MRCTFYLSLILSLIIFFTQIPTAYSSGWNNKKWRTDFIENDVIAMKQGCDKTFDSYMTGVTSEMAEGSRLYITCLKTLAKTTVNRLYKNEDIDQKNVIGTIEETEKNLKTLYFFSDQLYIFCQDNNTCDYGGGTMYDITPMALFLISWSNTSLDYVK